jgi:hypothetical protein
LTPQEKLAKLDKRVGLSGAARERSKLAALIAKQKATVKPQKKEKSNG